jgi:hypothetical protein
VGVPAGFAGTGALQAAPIWLLLVDAALPRRVGAARAVQAL